MKKTFIAFFILLIFCGAVFFIGWTQLRVEPDSCGIVVTKLNGASEKPIQPGEFYWNWEFLLPTNAQLITFKVTPVNLTKTTSGSLPSGQIYSSIYSSPNNFDYSFTISMTLSVSAEQIASMYKAGKISDNTTLTEYLNTCGDTISQLVANFYLKKLKDNPYLPIESYRRDEIVNSIRAYNEIPEVDIYQLALVSSKVPDYNLYDKMKKNYMENPVITNNNISTENENKITDKNKNMNQPSQNEEYVINESEIIGEI